MTPRGPVRHLVLDAEAASALLSSTQVNRKRAAVITAVAAANGERVVPTAVRWEARWDRTDPGAANANRLVRADDVLDRPGANRVAQLRRAVAPASVVDAAVALAPERVGRGGGVVEVLTSDVADLKRLSAHLALHRAEVRGWSPLAPAQHASSGVSARAWDPVARLEGVSSPGRREGPGETHPGRRGE